MLRAPDPSLAAGEGERREQATAQSVADALCGGGGRWALAARPTFKVGDDHKRAVECIRMNGGPMSSVVRV